MTKVLWTVLLAMLLAVPLAACGNGNDDDPPATAIGDGTPTSTSEVSEPASSASSPTTSAAASPATSPATSPTAGTFNDDEAALIDLLLSAGDLSGDWNQVSLQAPQLDGSPGICNAPRFPRAGERVAEIEVQYQSADGARFVLEDVTQFPEDVAVEAMAYVRDTSTCANWTDDTGTVFEISPVQAPQIGDESRALRVAFQVADAGKLEGEFVFFRIGGYLTIVTTLTLAQYDQAFSNDTASLAASKIDSLVGAGDNVTGEESALMARLLTLDQLGADWDQPQPAHRSEPQSWTGLCNAALFPDSDKAIARVAAEFSQGFEAASATLTQLAVAYPAGVAESAFDYEEEAAACGSFERGDAKITLERDNAFAALGDESFAIRFAYDNNGKPVNGYWIVFRSGNAVSTLLYTDPTEITADDVEAIASAAAKQLIAAP